MALIMSLGMVHEIPLELSCKFVYRKDIHYHICFAMSTICLLCPPRQVPSLPYPSKLAE